MERCSSYQYEGSKKLLVFVILTLIWLEFVVGVVAENRTVISRKHVGVWFDYSVRYYEHEADNAYSKDDLAVMINVVSKRFGRIAIDNAPELDKLPPESTVHSRVWVPSVVAQHNVKNPLNRMETVVTYGAAKIVQSQQISSFDVAKFMGDTANEIYEGTVKTLMMFSGFSIFSLFYTNVKETVEQLKVAREKINNSTYGARRHDYELGIFLDLKDCGHFKGPLGQKMKDVLPHVEMVAFLLRPNHHMSVTTTPAEIMHKMFVTKFEDCEKKLRNEKGKIKVVPVIMWMSRKGAVKGFFQFWEMMSEWAKKNEKEILMYEAFDTPQGRLISDQGWWRLRDKSEHVITEDIFVEKIEDGNQSSGKMDSPYSTEDSYDEDGEVMGSQSGGGLQVSSNKMYTEISPPPPIYMVLVLLCVICTLLVAVIVGMVWGFHSTVLRGNNYRPIYQESGNNGHGVQSFSQRRRQTQLSSIEEDGGDTEGGESCTVVNGAILEIRDTTPIVAVAYKRESL